MGDEPGFLDEPLHCRSQGRGVASGVYLYRLVAGEFSDDVFITARMTKSTEEIDRIRVGPLEPDAPVDLFAFVPGTPGAELRGQRPGADGLVLRVRRGGGVIAGRIAYADGAPGPAGATASNVCDSIMNDWYVAAAVCGRSTNISDT